MNEMRGVSAIIAAFVVAAFVPAGCVPDSPELTPTTKARNYVRSGYKALVGRLGPHAGMDFTGVYGEPVIAAADGIVSWARNSTPGCGGGVSLHHLSLEPFGRYTVYCHMSKVVVRKYQRVERGQIIGYVGRSGDARGSSHVHFEVSRDGYAHKDGDTEFTDNPARFLVGCFDPKATYPEGKLVLTEPLACTGN